MLGGAIVGAGVLLFFPIPVRPYIVGHELTHALWAKMCGGKVSQIKINSHSGYVVSDCNNFLVTLAPYIFPFYAWLFWMIYLLAALWIHDAWVRKMGWVTIGFGLAFHYYFLAKVIFTIPKQSDFKSQGYFFSYIVILIGNAALLLAIFWVQQPLLPQLKRLAWDVAGCYQQTYGWFAHWVGGR